MTYYGWNIYTLRNRIKELEEKKKRVKDDYLKELMDNDINILEDIIGDYLQTSGDSIKLIEEYNIERDNLNNLKFLWQDFFYYRWLSDKKYIPYSDLKTVTFSKDDLFEITHNFYKELDHSFYGNFMKGYRRRTDHVNFVEECQSDDYPYQGETIYINSLNDVYMTLVKNNSYDDILTSCHEYAHVISWFMNQNIANNGNIFFCETFPIFVELLASDYINKEFKTNDGTLLRGNIEFSNNVFSEELTTFLKIMDEEERQGHPFERNKDIKIAANKLGLENEDIEDMLVGSSSQLKESYLTSYLYAVELYQIYKEDKEKALYLMKKMIYLDKANEEKYFSEIKKLGLNLNERSNDYHNKLYEDIRVLKK